MDPQEESRAYDPALHELVARKPFTYNGHAFAAEDPLPSMPEPDARKLVRVRFAKVVAGTQSVSLEKTEVEESVSEAPAPAPAPRKRGRPKGSKDKSPRTRRKTKKS